MIADHYAAWAPVHATVNPALLNLVEAVDLFLSGMLTRSELQHAWRPANRIAHPDGDAVPDEQQYAAFLRFIGSSESRRTWSVDTAGESTAA